MALIYITGPPGAGKSTLEQELRNRGLETYDMDDPMLGGAHNKVTGERVEIPPAAYRAENWFQEHEWRTSRPAIQQLKDRGAASTILLCGVAPDDAGLLPLFDIIMYLDVDEETLTQRLLNREGNDYGKNPFELVEILQRSQELHHRYAKLGVVMIDGALQPQKIIDFILDNI